MSDEARVRSYLDALARVNKRHGLAVTWSFGELRVVPRAATDWSRERPNVWDDPLSVYVRWNTETKTYDDDQDYGVT